MLNITNCNVKMKMMVPEHWKKIVNVLNNTATTFGYFLIISLSNMRHFKDSETLVRNKQQHSSVEVVLCVFRCMRWIGARHGPRTW